MLSAPCSSRSSALLTQSLRIPATPHASASAWYAILTREGGLGAVEGGDGEVVSRLEEGLAALNDGRRDLVGACEVSLRLHDRGPGDDGNRADRGPKPKLKADCDQAAQPQ